MSCGIGHRRGADPTLLWLWCRLAAAALIRLLAWELPYATGAALKRHTHAHTHMNMEPNISTQQKTTHVEKISLSVLTECILEKKKNINPVPFISHSRTCLYPIKCMKMFFFLMNDTELLSPYFNTHVSHDPQMSTLNRVNFLPFLDKVYPYLSKQKIKFYHFWIGGQDWHMHTIVYGMDGQQGSAAQNRELYSTFCDNLYRKRT